MLFLKKMLDLVTGAREGWLQNYLPFEGLINDDEEDEPFGVEIKEECKVSGMALLKEVKDVAHEDCGLNGAASSKNPEIEGFHNNQCKCWIGELVFFLIWIVKQRFYVAWE
ncbi:hypothetical protein SUGI_0564390 [Cryptomeria japonica]|nr:hypothetical protein SUGI_0564390 [Cryptomeria japonica]